MEGSEDLGYILPLLGLGAALVLLGAQYSDYTRVVSVEREKWAGQHELIVRPYECKMHKIQVGSGDRKRALRVHTEERYHYRFRYTVADRSYDRTGVLKTKCPREIKELVLMYDPSKPANAVLKATGEEVMDRALSSLVWAALLYGGVGLMCAVALIRKVKKRGARVESSLD